MQIGLNPNYYTDDNDDDVYKRTPPQRDRNVQIRHKQRSIQLVPLRPPKYSLWCSGLVDDCSLVDSNVGHPTGVL